MAEEDTNINIIQFVTHLLEHGTKIHTLERVVWELQKNVSTVVGQANVANIELHRQLQDAIVRVEELEKANVEYKSRIEQIERQLFVTDSSQSCN